MKPKPQKRREAIAAALRGIGLSDDPAQFDSDIHSWRCRYPERYGRCDCFTEAVETTARAVEEIDEEEKR